MRLVLMAAPTLSTQPLTYSPSPDDYSVTAIRGRAATFRLNASEPVVWNWSSTGSLPGATVSNGGTASSISFSLSNNAGSDKECTITVTSNGNTWTIDLLAQGSGSP